MDMNIKEALENNQNITKVNDKDFILDKLDDVKRYMSIKKYHEARIAANEVLRKDKYNTEAWLAKYEVLKEESKENGTWIDNISNDNFESIVTSKVLEYHLNGLKESNNKSISSVVEACNEIKSLIEKYNAFKDEYEKKKQSDEERYIILERKINEYLGNRRLERVKTIANKFNMSLTAGTTQYGDSASFIYGLTDTEMFFSTVEGHPARYKSSSPMGIDEKERIFYELAPKFKDKEIKEKGKFLGIFG